MKTEIKAQYKDLCHGKILKDRTMIIPPHFLAALSQPITFDIVVLLPMKTCIVVYTINSWNNFRNKILGTCEADERMRPFVKRVIGDAVDVEINTRGKIILPQSIHEETNLGNKITFAMGSDSITVMRFGEIPHCLEEKKC